MLVFISSLIRKHSSYRETLLTYQIFFVSFSTITNNYLLGLAVHFKTMEHIYSTVSLLFASLLLTSSVRGVTIDGWSWSHQMDTEGKYELRTDVDLTSKLITFSVNLSIMPEIDQWIGIGLASSSSWMAMGAADIVIVVNNDTDGYMTDYFTNSTGGLWMDENNLSENYTDWTQDKFEAMENFTLFSVTRSFEVHNATEDREIKDERIYLLWAFGNETDDDGVPDLLANYTTKGYLPVNLLRYPASGSVNVNVNLLSFVPVVAIVIFASINNFVKY